MFYLQKAPQLIDECCKAIITKRKIGDNLLQLIAKIDVPSIK